MRRPIDSVPKDGTTVILDDDVTGIHQLARWSSETSSWVTPDGATCVMNPTHWLALLRDAELVEKTPDRTEPGEIPNNRKSSICLEHEQPGPPAARAPPIAPELPTCPVMPEEARKTRRWRTPRCIKLVCGLTLIVVSLTGMYFRSDMAERLTGRARSHDGPQTKSSLQTATENLAMQSVPSAPETTSLRANSGSATEPAAPPKDNVPKAREGRPGTDETRAPADVDQELARLRQELVSKDILYKNASGAAKQREIELKRAVDSATELQQALQQAQNRIETLQRELMVSVQRGQQTTLPSRQVRTPPQRQQKSRRQVGFFGEN